MTETADAAWARIIPFLRPIEGLIRDPEVSDILVNGERGVFFEKQGRLMSLSGVSISEKSLQVAARNIARTLGDEISEESPLLDSRLPDGSRVAIALSPVSVGGTAVAIRKFQNQRYQADELVRIGTLSPDALKLLQDAVFNREAILISGGTGTGKTTLLNALAASIPDEERIAIIEDTAEIQIEKPDWFRLEARREQTDLRPVTIRDLLRITLRMRPDRILLGEVRGAEAFDLLQAMNTGHQGTLCTIHANTATATLTRFISYVMMAGIEIPYRSLRSNIADVVSVIVHIDRRNGTRYVDEILRIHGYDTVEDSYELETIFQRPDLTGVETANEHRPPNRQSTEFADGFSG